MTQPSSNADGYPAPDHESEKKEADKKGDDALTVAPSAPKVQPAPRQRNERDDRQRNGRENLTLALELLGLLVLSIYTAVTYGQLRAVHEQLAASQEASRLDQRAWVLPDSISPSGPVSIGQPIRPVTEFRNTGRTPARNLRIVQNMMLWQWKLPEKIPLRVFSADGIPIPKTPKGPTDFITLASNVMLAPNHTTTMKNGTDIVIGEKEWAALTGGESWLFVKGRIEYNDVFNCAHWATYCAVLNPSTNQFEPCDHDNDVDQATCQH